MLTLLKTVTYDRYTVFTRGKLQGEGLTAKDCT